VENHVSVSADIVLWLVATHQTLATVFRQPQQGSVIWSLPVTRGIHATFYDGDSVAITLRRQEDHDEDHITTVVSNVRRPMSLLYPFDLFSSF